jgi:hypothetical protein
MRSILTALAVGLFATAAHAYDIRGDRYTTAGMVPSWTSPFPNGKPDGYGVFETEGDSDWFKVDLTAGHDYALTCGDEGSPEFVSRLRNPSGDIVEEIACGGNYDGPLYSGAEVRASTTGTYFVEALSAPRFPSQGELMDYDTLIVPDCRGDKSTNCTIKPGAVRISQTAFSGLIDVDWFKVSMQQGKRYTIREECRVGATLELITSDGKTVVAQSYIPTHYDGTPEPDGLIQRFTPKKTGTYYVAATCVTDDGDGDIYDYRLSMK